MSRAKKMLQDAADQFSWPGLMMAATLDAQDIERLVGLLRFAQQERALLREACRKQREQLDAVKKALGWPGSVLLGDDVGVDRTNHDRSQVAQLGRKADDLPTWVWVDGQDDGY